MASIPPSAKNPKLQKPGVPLRVRTDKFPQYPGHGIVLESYERPGVGLPLEPRCCPVQGATW